MQSDDIEIDRQDEKHKELFKKALNYEMRFFLPALAVVILCGAFEIFSCGTSCVATTEKLRLAIYACSFCGIIILYMLYESLSLSSKYQATIGMRKAGIYATRQDKTKHSFLSAIAIYLPILLFAFIMILLDEAKPWIKHLLSNIGYELFTIGTPIMLMSLMLYFVRKVRNSRRYFIGHK